MVRRLLVTIALSACLVPSLSAWNETGHRLIAAIAYDHLTPQACARVDALLGSIQTMRACLQRTLRPIPLARRGRRFWSRLPGRT